MMNFLEDYTWMQFWTVTISLTCVYYVIMLIWQPWQSKVDAYERQPKISPSSQKALLVRTKPAVDYKTMYKQERKQSLIAKHWQEGKKRNIEEDLKKFRKGPKL